MKLEGQTDCLLCVTLVKLHPIKVLHNQVGCWVFLCKLFEWILFFLVDGHGRKYHAAK